MSPPARKTSRELVLPDRVKLRALRDQYMSDMAATSYDEVRDKFLQELKSKRDPGDADGPRERGAGLWNSAFASKGRMLRSSIVLLAEFFDVAPEVLMLKPESDNSSKDEEVKPMSDLPVEPAVNALIAYCQRSPKLGVQLRHLCQLLAEQLQRHLQVPLSELIREGLPPEVEPLRESILQAARVEPGIYALILRISRMSSQPRPAASRVAKPTVRGNRNQVVTVQGDLHIPNGSLFNNSHTDNSYTDNSYTDNSHTIHMGPNSGSDGMGKKGSSGS